MYMIEIKWKINLATNSFIYLKWFTNDMYNASQGFYTGFETLQIFEIGYPGAKVTNINIWVSSSFSHNFLYFLKKWFTNGSRNAS